MIPIVQRERTLHIGAITVDLRGPSTERKDFFMKVLREAPTKQAPLPCFSMRGEETALAINPGEQLFRSPGFPKLGLREE